ncbi:MAG: cytochrome P450 [Methylacidiphilales bacterium]|nr:cytochrome P450 [Candidatus Methylacidiphilales bacterium]
MQLPNRLSTPPFLQKLQWIADPVKFMDNAVQQYPDIFTAEIVGFGDTVVFVNHPQGIQEILNSDRNNFIAIGEANKVLRPVVGDYSILMMEREQHRRRRQFLMPSFHGEKMRIYGELMCGLTEEVLSQLPQGKPFSAHAAMQEISLQVILKAVLGLSGGERCKKLKNLLPQMLLSLFHSSLTSTLLFFPFLQHNLGGWSPWAKFVHQRQEIGELLYAEICERRRQGNLNGVDILSLLISSKDKAGEGMTDFELRDELITLIVAGYETTATAMAWGLYWIHQQLNVREKIIAEIDSLDNVSDPMSIFRLPYLTAVCNESLRIHPITPFTFPRQVQETTQLLGNTLEPGMIVQGCIYLAHQREDLYPQAKQFRPERFLEREFSLYEFLPFGGGARRCIGETLAIFEMKLVLATILSRYQLELVDKQPEKLKRRGPTLAPGNGVKMIITGQREAQKSINMKTTAIL